jgi:predicted RecA/RadA family phage recombinase
MAKNFVQPGDNITITAAAAVKSGEVVIVGRLFGVAVADIAAGQKGILHLGGVWDLPKNTGAGEVFAEGAAVYWDATNKRCTVTATGNTDIGSCVAAVTVNTVATVRVRLND